jgi:hypothetical protein
MFDPAVIGTANIGMRGIGVGRTGVPNQRPSRRRSLRRRFSRRVASGMRAVAEWIDPIRAGQAAGGPPSDAPSAPSRAAASSRT